MVIPQFCREHKIDLLVLGAVGRLGISGLLIGNTGEAIANEVDCSLIAVKAAGARIEVARRHGPALVSAGVAEHDDEHARPAVSVGE